jgi:hypothetical protein
VASESAEPDVDRREFLIDVAVRNPLEPIELMCATGCPTDEAMRQPTLVRMARILTNSATSDASSGYIPSKFANRHKLPALVALED